MKKGKFFETVIRHLHEALKNDVNTRVWQNHQLIDNADLRREFDIIIQTVVNNIEINIAIECKDHKGKINVGLIEAFNTKCQDVPTIHAKAFISRNGFQKGAIAKAKMHGIKLSILEKLDSDISHWLPLSIPQAIRVERFITTAKAKYEGEGFQFKPQDTIIIEEAGISQPLQEFLAQIVKDSLPNFPLVITVIGQPKPKLETIGIQIEFVNAYIQRGEMKSKVTNIWFELEQSYSDLKSDYSVNQHVDMSSGQPKTNVLAVVSEDENQFSFIRKESDDLIDIFHKPANAEDKIYRIAQIEIKRN